MCLEDALESAALAGVHIQIETKAFPMEEFKPLQAWSGEEKEWCEIKNITIKHSCEMHQEKRNLGISEEEANMRREYGIRGAKALQAGTIDPHEEINTIVEEPGSSSQDQMPTDVVKPEMSAPKAKPPERWECASSTPPRTGQVPEEVLNQVGKDQIPAFS